MWTIFKVFTEFVIILLLFYVLVFLGTRHVGILVPRSEMEPWSRSTEFQPLGRQGKSQTHSELYLASSRAKKM